MRVAVGNSWTWRKSSYSGPGDGNECVEIAISPTYVGVRDSKTRSRPVLTFPAPAFAAFIESLRYQKG
ncbi:DUF397 domain-containing protein [Streptomyces sp. KAU_LT]|uniref:DUF397 domain-containing protein n=1 Tax=Streptomyces sp. KAU_LT TaxID=3046669 RepID=UPI0024B82A94|nr:DUF397 domain-containing protein [Streptomyces sp. KAU_LT]MDI9834909.1 DUF397 domain-containing protein [Streptomyces sp. KAU_LT]